MQKPLNIPSVPHRRSAASVRIFVTRNNVYDFVLASFLHCEAVQKGAVLAVIPGSSAGCMPYWEYKGLLRTIL